MTVKHLQAVQRHQLAVAVAHDPQVLGKFKSGFSECAQEITRLVYYTIYVENLLYSIYHTYKLKD